MMKKSLLALGAVCVLSACPMEQTEPTVSQEVRELAECRHPAVLPDIRDNLRQTVRREAQRFASQDKRNFVDADKMAAVAERLQVRMQSVKADSQVCTAQINVIIPQSILDAAERYAPLLESASPAEIILNRTANNNLRFDGQALMAQIDYKVNADTQNFAVNYADSNLSLLGNVITSALLGYGVKDMIVVNGKPINRDNAVKNMVASVPVQTIRPNEVETLNPPPPIEPPPPVVRREPEAVEPLAEPESRISDSQLNSARAAHQRADSDIKNAWRHIDPTIQQNLVEEQHAWEDRKNQTCRQASERGHDDAESQYLHIQCDIRETQKRIKYLNGYRIE